MAEHQEGDDYPLREAEVETNRLRQQQLLFNSAAGFLNAPVDLSQPDLRVLDSCTAGGSWLLDLAEEIPATTTASLYGVDIQQYSNWELLMKDASEFSSNCKAHFRQQDIREEWPEEWKGTFDLVHQKLALHYMKSQEERQTVLRHLIDMVKPGGWIQLDEGGVDIGEFSDDDTPFDTMLKYFGHWLQGMGFTPRTCNDMRDVFDGFRVRNIGYREGRSLISQSTSTEALRQASTVQLQGLLKHFRDNIIGHSPPMITSEEGEKLLKKVQEQVRSDGGYMSWCSTWAQKV